MLRAGAEGQDANAREEAWAELRPIVKQHKRERLRDAARARHSAWINNYLAAAAVEYGTLLINPGSGMDASSVRRAAIPPLMDAIAATVTFDVLDASLQATLLEPMTVVSSRGKAR